MKKRLLFLGDSLIEYFDWAERFPEHSVFNLGISGETVEGLSSRLGKIFGKVEAPDIIFIMSGINNMAMGDAAFIDAYRGMVRKIKKAYPPARIIVHSLLPVLFPFIANEDIRHMNVRLRHLAEDETVSYCDIHSRFLGENGQPVSAYLMDDGVHVSEEGYRIWSAEIERIIE